MIRAFKPQIRVGHNLFETIAFPLEVDVTASTNTADAATERRRRENLQIDPDFAYQLKRDEGFVPIDQFMVEIDDISCVMTVEICESQASGMHALRMNSSEGLARFPGVSLPATATLTEFAPSTGVTDLEAQTEGLLYEVLDDDGVNDDVLIIAPHGGGIETNTDDLADELKIALEGAGRTVSTWYCRGYSITPGQTSYDKWHVTSVSINPVRFPMLNGIMSRDFAVVLGIHGQGTSNRIDVGGNLAIDSTLDAIVTALDAETDLNDQTIAKTESSGLEGQSARNIGNQLCPTSDHYVQLELGPEVRGSGTKRTAVVNAVTSIY